MRKGNKFAKTSEIRQKQSNILECKLQSNIQMDTNVLKPVRNPVAIFGSLGVCIYVPASRHWLILYSSIHLT